ncbi:MAG: L-2-amino-thiazoline-4-carboxylic acid hydrolase [Clostridiales bacterium]|jgi:hypothetical protein|nr:L-2-amino-thiazoline-4-carboxylic acid hydrolase [Clostridiales bacterium]
MNYEKMIKKSKLAAAYAELDAENRQTALSEYKVLCAEHDLSDKMLAAHLLNAILPAVALYRVLARSSGKDAAFSAIRIAMLDSARPMTRVFRALGRLPFGFPLLRMITPLAMKTGFGESGWDMQWLKNTRKEIAVIAHSCFYDRILRQCGMSELTPVFCEFDDVVYGTIPHIRWGRTKTIGRGDALCDFRFINERQVRDLGCSPSEGQ